MKRFSLFVAMLLTVVGCSSPSGNSSSASKSAEPNSMQVYFGTYTGSKSKGIYRSRLDLKTGALSPPELVTESTSPSFLAIHPNGKFVYSANEVGNFGGEKAGAVTAFQIDPSTGNLKLLNQASSRGSGPCHLVVDRSGKNVLVANYGGGSVTSIKIKADGSLGESGAFLQHTGSSVNPQRQKEPHAHSINVDPGNRFAVAADLGLDKLLVYRFDSEKGSLTANDPAFAAVKGGAGPRHFAFHPKGKLAYVINEMDCTVTAFAFDPKAGRLTEIQTISSLPPGEEKQRGFSTAEVQVHPSGKFLYGSNRGHHSIVAFAIDPKKGTLRHVENESTQGKTPRNFGIDPTGNYLLAANQETDTVVVFKIDQKTGELNPTGTKISVPTPVCVKFVK